MTLRQKYIGTLPIKIPTIIAVVVLLCAVFDIGFFVLRHQFGHLLAAYSVAFVAYWVILQNQSKPLLNPPQRGGLLEASRRVKVLPSGEDLGGAEAAAILLRGVLVFSLPLLSDDMYRFVWDGRLISLGINPFDHPPQYFIDNGLYQDVLTPDLAARLNSPAYFSIYPPVCQALFTVAVKLFPTNLYGSIVVIKSFIFLSEIGTLILIKNGFKNRKAFLIYAFNPLVIIELCGNGHLEGIAIFFILLGIYFLFKSKTLPPIVSAPPQLSAHFNTQKNHFTQIDKAVNTGKIAAVALALALAIATKLTPLLCSIPLLRLLPVKRLISVGLIATVAVVVLFLPFFNATFFSNFNKSLTLYFTKFEFNASVYYVVSRLWALDKGYIPIFELAPILRIITILSMLAVVFGQFKKPIAQPLEWYFERCLFIFSVYFLMATTVHPWYATMPLAFAAFTRYRFPVLWSLMLVLTYAGYTEGSSVHTENYILIAVEYAAVIGLFFWEIFYKER